MYTEEDYLPPEKRATMKRPSQIADCEFKFFFLMKFIFILRERQAEPCTTTLLSLQRVRPCSTGLLETSPGTRCCRNPCPSRSVNAALPVINVYVEGKRCSALVDTGCSRSIVSADRCVTWNSQQIEIRTIDGCPGLLWCRDCVSPNRRRESCQSRRLGGTSKAPRVRPATWD
ncbi:unnamed protein product [Acanthosepion pharaonis]|uniref:Uncharacterized protein n=1 Tax=Acanthosepion pharaonis TaxID=158019 RepID=A0A812EGN7_ACAPH|nr:unnamed protein product [Sepia pharaonis]